MADGARVDAAAFAAALDRVTAAALDAGLKPTWKEIADRLTDQVRAAAATGTRQQAAAVGSLVGQADGAGATIEITGDVVFGPGAFLGALQYRQFPAWVGDSWDIEAGQGPYVVAPTIASHLPELVEQLETGMARTLTALGVHTT